VLTYAIPEGAPTPAQFEALITQTGALPAGERLYHTWCARCHGSGGVSSSSLPDLRDSLSRLGENFDLLARHGLPGTGMPDMGRFVSAEDAGLIRRYLESRAELTGR
jgi:mono/diheme cytochrome c family protein